MEVGYGQLVAILGVLHPGLEASIVARLQYLQRSDFPVKKQQDAVRTDYGAEGLLKLVLTFEILAAGAPPAYVVELIDSGWGEVSEMLATAWAVRGTHRHAVPIFVRIRGIGAKKRDVGTLGAGTVDELRQWLQGKGSDRSVLVVDAMRLMMALGAAMASGMAGTDFEFVATSIDEWAGRRREASWK